MANNVTPSQNTQPPTSTGASPIGTEPERLFTADSTRGNPTDSGDGLLAALERLGNNIYDPAVMLKELQAQLDIHAEPDKTKRSQLIGKFYNKVLGSTSLMVFGGIKNGYVRVLHGIGQYHAGLVEDCDYDEAVVAFMGDRVQSRTPAVVKLTSKRMAWVVEKDTITSETTLRTFYATGGNSKKSYTLAADDAKEDVILPTLLYIPRGLVKFLVEKPRTPWELYLKVLNDLGGEQVDQRPTQLKVVLAWLRRACMAGTGTNNKNKSISELGWESVLVGDFPNFDKWLIGRLNTVLGPPESEKKVPAQTVTHVHHYEKPRGDNPFDNSQNNNAGEEKDKNDKGKLTALQKSALMGWSRKMHEHELPVVWANLESTTSAKEMRRYVDEAWEDSRVALNIDIGECSKYFLEDQTLKDWKDGDFAPGGSVPIWDYLMKGMSILLVMNFSTLSQLKAEEREKVYQETLNTRTEEQAEKRVKKEPRQPPQDWSPMKYVLNTYAIFLHAFFTADCPHFRSCWALRSVMVSMRDLTRYFTSQACNLITYHIIKDSRQFFAEKLMPRDFEDTLVSPMWPESHLADTAKHVKRLQFNALWVDDLPYKWRPKQDTSGNKRTNQDSGGRSLGGPSEWRAQGSGGGHSSYSYGSPSGGTFTGDASKASGGDHNFMPQSIRDQIGVLVDDILKMKPNFGAKELREIGGLQMYELPKLPGYDEGGRCMMCKSGLIGCCHWKSRCKFKKVKPNDVTPDYARQFVQTLGPALQKCFEFYRRGGQSDEFGRPITPGSGGQGSRDMNRYGPRQF